MRHGGGGQKCRRTGEGEPDRIPPVLRKVVVVIFSLPVAPSKGCEITHPAVTGESYDNRFRVSISQAGGGRTSPARRKRESAAASNSPADRRRCYKSAALKPRSLFYQSVCVCACRVSGYTREEKVEIAHRHLIPNQLEQHGLTPQQLHVPQDTTQDVISRCAGGFCKKHIRGETSGGASIGSGPVLVVA